MTTSFMQGVSVANGSTTSPQTLTIKNTAGACMVLFITVQNATTLSSVTDSNNNTWNQIYKNVAGGSSNVISVYYAMNIVGGSNTISVALGASGWSVATVVQEFFGVATSNALDTNAHNTITTWANPQSGAAVTTTNANDILVAGFFQATGATFTLGTGYTHLTVCSTASGPGEVGIESQSVQSTGTYTPTMGTGTTGFGGDSITVALKAQPGKSFQGNNLRAHAFSPGLAR